MHRAPLHLITPECMLGNDDATSFVPLCRRRSDDSHDSQRHNNSPSPSLDHHATSCSFQRQDSETGSDGADTPSSSASSQLNNEAAAASFKLDACSRPRPASAAANYYTGSNHGISVAERLRQHSQAKQSFGLESNERSNSMVPDAQDRIAEISDYPLKEQKVEPSAAAPATVLPPPPGLQVFTCDSKAELQALLEDSFGAYLIEQKASVAESPVSNSRRSIDMLLDVPSSGTNSSRHSLDSLQELLSPRWSTADAFACLSLRLQTTNATTERHSADADRRFADKESTCRLGSLASSTMSRPISATTFHDFAKNTVTVVAKPTPAASSAHAPGGSAGVAGSTVTVCASSLVDVAPAARSQPSKGGAVQMQMPPPGGSPPPARTGTFGSTGTSALMDADVHDTFGAHAWYVGSGGGTGASAGSAGMLSAAVRASSPPRASRYGRTLSNNSSTLGSGPTSPVDITKTPSPNPDFQKEQQTSAGRAALARRMDLGAKSKANLSGQYFDTYSSVPSYAYLKQRQEAKLRLQQQEITGGGGYIAEAKRVLSDAMKSASRSEADLCEASYSGAIGPLVRYLRQHRGNDAALLSGLHTLSLLVSNSPNRAIIAGYEGQSMLVDIMRSTQDLNIKEQAVQILWDVSSSSAGVTSGITGVAPQIVEEEEEPACAFQPEDLQVLITVLEETSSAITASQVLHLLHTCLGPPSKVACSSQQLTDMAARLVTEVATHKHHLQDAAQYSLGMLLAGVLGHIGVAMSQVGLGVSRLSQALVDTAEVEQCQVLLTVLSCLAGNPRVKDIMVENKARGKLLQFSQKTSESRMRTRALSLAKVLNKEEEQVSGWYFGE